MRLIIILAILILLANNSLAQETAYRKQLDGNDKYPEYKVNESDDKLVQLKKRRINALLNAYESTQMRIKFGDAEIMALGKLHEKLLDAQMDFHDNKTEKLKVLNKALQLAKDIEAQYVAMADGGSVRMNDVELASYFRLDVEIRLEKCKLAGD